LEEDIDERLEINEEEGINAEGAETLRTLRRGEKTSSLKSAGCGTRQEAKRNPRPTRNTGVWGTRPMLLFFLLQVHLERYVPTRQRFDVRIVIK
jgi:hypothetical protein